VPVPGDLAARDQRDDERGERGDSDEVPAQAIAMAATAPDPVAAAHLLSILLDQMRPFDATRTAALAALSTDGRVRHAVAEALSWDFALVGDDVVLDHLAGDEAAEVRFAVARAAHVRRWIGDGVLRGLLGDPDPRVAATARFALAGRRG